MQASNYDSHEISKFNELAAKWWDPESEFKPLHQINPIRLNYIEGKIGSFKSKILLDVGSGGGILAESMALRGGFVTGIDMAPAALQVAKQHAIETGVSIDYHQVTVEDFAEKHAESFDVVTCMEMLEHVPDPASVVQACARLCKPGGQVFFSTINRNPKAYLFAIIGAEYLLRLLPRGTHHYEKFITPAELTAWCRQAGLATQDLTGMTYQPITKKYSLSTNIDVNYLLQAVKR